MLLSVPGVWIFDAVGKSLTGEPTMSFSVADAVNDYPANY